MAKEKLTGVKVGDRISLTPHLPGYLVVDVRHAEKGAIGIYGDLPEHEEAVRKAIEGYTAAVRSDETREESPRRNWCFDQPPD